MKKTMIFAAFAALISLASCQKEDVIDNGTDKKASPVFTASIAGSTKTTVNVTDGKVAWEESDEITITDGLSKSAVYKIESIDATTGRATFVFKEGNAIATAPYVATYGTAPAISQTYSATAGKLYMTAATADNSFTFDVLCGLMKLNLTKTDESVKSIAVTGTPTSGTETTYTLTCNPAQSIASAKDFYIALPAGSYTKIEITNSSDITCTLNSASGLAIAANHIKPVTFDETKINFAPALPDGALSGKFTINADGGKVYFSKGNLYYNGSTFQLEENQYDIATSWSTSTPHVSNFFWSKDAAQAYADSFENEEAETGDVFFTNAADFTVNEQTGVWRTLSADEWTYLFDHYTYKYTTVCNKNGIVIAPTGVTTIEDSYDATNWPTAESNGYVFLPITGYRSDDTISENKPDEDNTCLYWSSTLSTTDEKPYRIFFKYYYDSENSKWNLDTNFMDANNCNWGIGIRLVADVQ